MGIERHPGIGAIVRVDLSEGFSPPEMGKRRPAIVMSPALPGRNQLCCIVPLSTTSPTVVQPYHYLLELDPPLPHPYSDPVMWVKADMIMSVAFHRLQLLFHGKDKSGQRIYDRRVLNAHQIKAIRACIRYALGMND